MSVRTDDPATSRRGERALIVLYGALACGLPSLVALSFIPDGKVLAAIIGLFLVVSWSCTRLVRRGQVDVGVWLFIASMLLGQFAFPLVSGDARLTAVYLVVPVAVAGLCLDSRGTLIVGGIAATAAVALSVRYPSTEPPIGTVEVELSALILIGFILVTTLLGAESLRHEAHRADEEAQRAHELAATLAAANEELEARVVRRTRDLEHALARQETLVAELAELSVRDSLTGLYNRRHADEELPRLLAASARYGHSLALAMADLDFFKQVNDDHTYAVGDEVLRRVAGILEETARAADVTTRYGGEEFLVLMPETSLSEGAVLCERLRVAVEKHPWHEVADGLRLTISIGVAAIAGAVDDAGALLSSVDASLHRAKREGRNRVVRAEQSCGLRVTPSTSTAAS